MGFFSWDCSKCGKSIYCIDAGKPKWLSQCYLLLPYKDIYESAYEGYGVFGGFDIYELLGDGDRNEGINLYFDSPDSLPFKIKIVHKRCFNNDRYEDLFESIPAEGQGYFF